MTFINQFKLFNKYFWLYNFIQALERIGTWILIVQLPIYISQKGVVGGLEFEQYQKGIIYFFWAFSQNFTSTFVGGIADKFGKKKVMRLSLIIIILSLVSLAFQRNIYLFTLNLTILGISSGFFKPALQGKIAENMNKENSALGWGIYVWIINLSIFALGTPLAKHLKEISWEWIFLGASLIFIVNFLTLMLFKDEDEIEIQKEEPFEFFKRILKGILEPKVLFFILPIVGFTMIYMQFYETLPNYIYDWIPTSEVINYFNIGSIFISNDIIFGNRLSYEWIYGINTGIIILLIIPFTYLFSKFNKILAISIGLFIAVLGFSLCGYQANGFYLIFGIIIYTIGEMITNPKLSDYISSIAPEKHKSQYLGYMGFAWTIGLSFGGLIGGYLYGILGERESLAKKVLLESNITLKDNQNYFGQYSNFINKHSNASINDVSSLYHLTNPYQFFDVFIFVGLVSIVGLLLYWKKYK